MSTETDELQVGRRADAGRALSTAFAEDLVTDLDILESVRADQSSVPSVLPVALLRARSTAQVQEAVRICRRFDLPVGVTGRTRARRSTASSTRQPRAEVAWPASTEWGY